MLENQSFEIIISKLQFKNLNLKITIKIVTTKLQFLISIKKLNLILQ